ncbi:MAG: glycoside hydrolase family 125 protein [Gemmatimonadaceae bacterium]
MSLRPPPRVPWQVTGNHWLSLPCIHPADGAVFAVGFLHRGTRSAIEFAGAPGFVEGDGPPLMRPRLRIGTKEYGLTDAPMAWERALGWLPTFTWTLGDVAVRGTVFAPFGRDSDVAGAVYALSLENRGDKDLEATFVMEGTLGHRQLRVQTERPFEDGHVVQEVEGDVILGGRAAASIVAIALGADESSRVRVEPGDSPRYTIERPITAPAGGRAQFAFYLAAGPEPDGARASMAVLRRRGWKDLLRDTRDALQSLEQTTGHESLDGLINRNLLFAYFYSIGRALDDAHYYIVRSRAPWHGRGVTVRDWEALTWILPAIQLADPALARELLLRTCELHGYAPGRGVHYFEGTMFAPGFCLEGAAGYAVAVDRYIRDTSDEHIVDEPIIADTLYLSSEDLAARRDRNLPLYTTEVLPGGDPAPFAFTLHANAVVAQALDVLRRTLDEETAKNLEDPDAVRAALKRHFVAEYEGKQLFAAATDLAGHYSFEDDAVGSALWLPLYEAVERHDSTYRRTVKRVASAPSELARECARLLGPDSSKVLEWFRRAPLDGGYAAEIVGPEGQAKLNGGDASLSGLLAWTAWYAVHALGERP